MGDFDAKAHISQIKGKDYLEVKWRLVWFRTEHPADSGWAILTEAEEVTETSARYRARIVDPEGRPVATGTKTETKSGFTDFVEKAETGAIGRALALLGYGTQFCGDELDEGARIVDSPVSSPAARQGNSRQHQTPAAIETVADLKRNLLLLGVDSAPELASLLDRVGLAGIKLGDMDVSQLRAVYGLAYTEWEAETS